MGAGGPLPDEDVVGAGATGLAVPGRQLREVKVRPTRYIKLTLVKFHSGAMITVYCMLTIYIDWIIEQLRTDIFVLF